MKTIEEIKAEIVATNPSRISKINDEEIELNDADYADTITKRAEMEYEQQVKAKEATDARTAAEAKFAALGLTVEDLKALGF